MTSYCQAPQQKRGIHGVADAEALVEADSAVGEVQRQCACRECVLLLLYSPEHLWGFVMLRKPKKVYERRQGKSIV